MINVIEDLKKKEFLCTVGRDVYRCNSQRNILWRFHKKFRRELLCDAWSHFWIYSQRKWNIVSKRYPYSHAHCSIIHSSLVIETTIFQQVNGLKQCDVTYIGKYYLAIRKRKNLHICGNMDETGGHHAKWTKSKTNTIWSQL